MVSNVEDKGAIGETTIEVQVVSEAECDVRNVERKADEILKMEYYSEPDNRIVERPNEFLSDYAGGNKGSIKSTTKFQFFLKQSLRREP